MQFGNLVSSYSRSSFSLKYVLKCLTDFITLAGPKLTQELGGFPLVTTNQGVFLVGGEDKNLKNHQEIIQLYCHDDVIENCQWQEYEQQLQKPRGGHVVIPLPESYNICT